MALALEALDVLALTGPRIGRRRMETVLAREDDKHFPAPFRMAWYGAALDALRAAGPPQLATWLSRRCLTDDPDRVWRSTAALVALSGLAPTLTGSERRAATLDFVERLRGFARRSEGDFVVAHLQQDAAVCLARLAAASADGRFPFPLGRAPATEYRAVADWIRTHRDPDDPAWR